MSDQAKPFLRWAGSKKLILPKLAKYWNQDFNRYIEPFVGSAQLFYHLKPKQAILGDINGDLITTYRAVKKTPKLVHSILGQMRKGKNNYYTIRKQSAFYKSDIERAARFIYLNRFCFNGLYRTNKNGDFNVPYAGYKTGNLPTIENLVHASEILNKAKLVCEDFENTVTKNVGRNDFFYLDPPYALKNKRIFNQYDPQSFGLNDIDRMRTLLQLIHKKGAKFLLSYAFDEEVVKLFDEWNIEIVETQRNMTGFKKKKRTAKEVLISNINS
jgi:DNA adenine methylase